MYIVLYLYIYIALLTVAQCTPIRSDSSATDPARRAYVRVYIIRECMYMCM